MGPHHRWLPISSKIVVSSQLWYGPQVSPHNSDRRKFVNPGHPKCQNIFTFSVMLELRLKPLNRFSSWYHRHHKHFPLICREYPCDHYTAIINVTLMNTGCPRSNIHETALQLLQGNNKNSMWSNFNYIWMPSTLRQRVRSFAPRFRKSIIVCGLLCVWFEIVQLIPDEPRNRKQKNVCLKTFNSFY